MIQNLIPTPPTQVDYKQVPFVVRCNRRKRVFSVISATSCICRNCEDPLRVVPSKYRRSSRSSFGTLDTAGQYQDLVHHNPQIEHEQEDSLDHEDSLNLDEDSLDFEEDSLEELEEDSLDNPTDSPDPSASTSINNQDYDTLR